jgi:hypothetical protein
MFCAAIPAAAAVGVSVNNRQVQALRRVRETGAPPVRPRPVMKLTALVVAFLLVGSITYHTLRFGP